MQQTILKENKEMAYHILTDVQLTQPFLDLIHEQLGADCDIQVWAGDGSDPAENLANAEAIFIYGHPTFDGAVMETMPNLRVISNFGVGIDHINLDDARERGISVGNTPGFVDGATADMTIALMMAAARNIIPGNNYARSPEFTHYDPNLLHGQEVYGSTLGIIGLGRIGKEVAKRAAGFDMKILYHNRNRDQDAEKALGVTYTLLEELLQEADFVALNVPMTPQTHHLISHKELDMMKSTAILVNMARGGVVDHDALVDALRNRKIFCAALDVTEPEPLPRDHPLLTMDNVIIAPHLGSATTKTRWAMATRTVENLEAGLAGKPLLSAVA